MVTVVPPAVGPRLGETAPTLGGSAEVNWSAGPTGRTPSAVVTVTCTVASAVPPGPAGEVAVIDPLGLTVKLGELLAPNFTSVGLDRRMPLMVTLVPPPAGPTLGVTPSTAGSVEGLANIHTAPALPPSDGAPTSAEIPSARSATLAPNSALGEASSEEPTPVSLDPSTVQVLPDRSSSHAAPTELVSRGAPMSAVVPSEDRDRLNPNSPFPTASSGAVSFPP